MATGQRLRIVATNPGGDWAIEEAAVAAAGGVEFVVRPCQTEEELIAVGQEADPPKRDASVSSSCAREAVPRGSNTRRS